MLAAVPMPISVHGSTVMSLPDKFLSTTATPDPPRFNSEEFHGTNILQHLGEDSPNTWTHIWCPVTMVSPFTF